MDINLDVGHKWVVLNLGLMTIIYGYSMNVNNARTFNPYPVSVVLKATASQVG